jgi:uncharacterized sodium:solute symporter family permease YidK
LPTGISIGVLQAPTFAVAVAVHGEFAVGIDELVTLNVNVPVRPEPLWAFLHTSR